MKADGKLPPLIARGVSQHPGLDKLLALGQRKTFLPNTALFHADADALGLFYITTGSVSVLGEHDELRFMTHDYIGAGEFVGEIGLFVGAEPHKRTATVIARTQCEAIYITYIDVMKAAGTNASLLTLIAGQMAKRFVVAARRLQDMTFLDVQSRVHRILFDLAKKPEAQTHPDGMQIRVTRAEVATFVGCSREMVGRSIANLKSEGAIRGHGKTIVVLGAR